MDNGNREGTAERNELCIRSGVKGVVLGGWCVGSDCRDLLPEDGVVMRQISGLDESIKLGCSFNTDEVCCSGDDNFGCLSCCVEIDDNPVSVLFH